VNQRVACAAFSFDRSDYQLYVSRFERARIEGHSRLPAPSCPAAMARRPRRAWAAPIIASAYRHSGSSGQLSDGTAEP
jgi:hypothetical protein